MPVILVVAPSANRTFAAEILRAEGLPYRVVTLAALSAETDLAASAASYRVVILARVALTAAQETQLLAWVAAGGRLIVMRPASTGLRTACGLPASVSSTRSNAYIRINTAVVDLSGHYGENFQLHGEADIYAAPSGAVLAALFADSGAGSSLGAPAVVQNGRVICFAYDMVASVIGTRQGNAAWAGQERDGIAGVRASGAIVAHTHGHVPRSLTARGRCRHVLPRLDQPRHRHSPAGWHAALPPPARPSQLTARRPMSNSVSSPRWPRAC
jgi:hypothetical protein